MVVGVVAVFVVVLLAAPNCSQLQANSHHTRAASAARTPHDFTFPSASRPPLMLAPVCFWTDVKRSDPAKSTRDMLTVEEDTTCHIKG